MTDPTGSKPAQAEAARATQRPQPFTKPAYWSDAPPPTPQPASGADEELSPTRYGDWVKDGVAIDF